MTGREMCELAARYLKDSQGKDVSPDEIWNASPTGELIHVFELYYAARCYYDMPTHDALPETGSKGDIALVRVDGKTHVYIYTGSNWVMT